MMGKICELFTGGLTRKALAITMAFMEASLRDMEPPHLTIEIIRRMESKKRQEPSVVEGAVAI